MQIRRFWTGLAAILAVLLDLGPADACMTSATRDLNDIKYADVVLVGRIRDYKIVRDEKFRQRALANPKLPADLRAYYEGPETLLSDYALFKIDVIEVLAGEAPVRLTVTWDNSTFGEPATMAAGPYLLALRKADTKIPPIRGPSATILPNPEPQALTILQAPCASPFIFEPTSERANIVRAILAGQPYTGSAVDGGAGRF